MLDLNEIGGRIRDAYASSASEGQAAWMGYVGETLQVYHVPAMPSDGAVISALDMQRAGAAELQVLERIGVRINVQNARAAGDDMLVLETVFGGALPGEAPFAFPLTLVFRFDDGKISRLVEVGSAEMFATMRKAFDTVGAAAAPAA